EAGAAAGDVEVGPERADALEEVVHVGAAKQRGWPPRYRAGAERTPEVQRRHLEGAQEVHRATFAFLPRLSVLTQGIRSPTLQPLDYAMNKATLPRTHSSSPWHSPPS